MFVKLKLNLSLSFKPLLLDFILLKILFGDMTGIYDRPLLFTINEVFVLKYVNCMLNALFKILVVAYEIHINQLVLKGYISSCFA